MKSFSKVVLMTSFISFLAGKALAVCDTSKVINIEIKDMKYSPEHVEVCSGQTVVWTNKEPLPVGDEEPMSHTVTADPMRANKPENFSLPEGVAPFHSKGIMPGKTFQYTFTVIGEYKYFCVPHQDMGHIGFITVVSDQTEHKAIQD